MTDRESEMRASGRIGRRSFLFGLAGVVTLALGNESEAVGLFEPFTFGVVSDVHLATGQPDSYRLLQESQLFLQDAVKQLNVHKPDFVVFTGDQVETPGKEDANWGLFIDVMQTLTVPWYFVLGEQDVSGMAYVDKMRTYGPDFKGKGLESGKPYWSYEPVSGVRIIGLDTSRANVPTGDISSAQLNWLSDDLKRHQRRFTIVFSHHPLLPPPPFDSGPPWDEYTVPQGASAREILGSSKYVRLAISGHVHVSKVQQERDIWYVSCPSLDVYPCSYRIFRVSPEEIVVETYQIGFPALVKKARKMMDESPLAFKYNSAKPMVFAQLCEGRLIDQNARLPLVPGKQAEALQPRKPPRVDKKADKGKKDEKKEDKKRDTKKSDRLEEKKEEKKDPKSDSSRGQRSEADAKQDSKVESGPENKVEGKPESKDEGKTGKKDSKPKTESKSRTGEGSTSRPEMKPESEPQAGSKSEKNNTKSEKRADVKETGVPSTPKEPGSSEKAPAGKTGDQE